MKIKVLSWMLDLIFPIKCIFCGLISKKGAYICKKCSRSILIRKSFECIGCKKPVQLGQTCHICKKDFYIDNLFVVGDYGDQKVKNMLKYFKFNFIKDLHSPVYHVMARYLSWLIKNKGFNLFKDNPLLIPVPLSRYRLNWRGFNQSELLCQDITTHMQFESNTSLLSRIKSKPQTEIEAKSERQANIIGQINFVGARLSNRDIILVDDICTTGSTLNECAKVLKQNGAGKIYALVVARG